MLRLYILSILKQYPARSLERLLKLRCTVSTENGTEWLGNSADLLEGRSARGEYGAREIAGKHVRPARVPRIYPNCSTPILHFPAAMRSVALFFFLPDDDKGSATKSPLYCLAVYRLFFSNRATGFGISSADLSYRNGGHKVTHENPENQANDSLGRRTPSLARGATKDCWLPRPRRS